MENASRRRQHSQRAIISELLEDPALKWSLSDVTQNWATLKAFPGANAYTLVCLKPSALEVVGRLAVWAQRSPSNVPDSSDELSVLLAMQKSMHGHRARCMPQNICGLSRGMRRPECSVWLTWASCQQGIKGRAGLLIACLLMEACPSMQRAPWQGLRGSFEEISVYSWPQN